MATKKLKNMGMEMEKKKKKEDISGIFIPAGALLGVGIGLAFGNPGAGVLIGLGTGFLLMAIVKLITRK